MPGNFVHVGATLQCPHGGSISVLPANQRVRVNGQPVATATDTFLVAGCPFTVPATPPKPQPCVKTQWLVQSSRVKVGGQPVILQDSTGICQSAEQIPQGPPTVQSTQTKVRGI